MPTPPWANDAQMAFLKDRLLSFDSSQRSRTLPTFWSQTNRDFFERWPDMSSESEGLSDKEKKTLHSSLELMKGMTEDQWIVHRKKTIYNWYNNHGLKKKRAAGSNNSVKITLPQSASRLSSEAHLYSKRYYDSRVKHLVEAEIGDRKLKRNERLKIVNKHLTQCFQNESAEIKEEIKKAREEERVAKETAQSQDIAVAKAVEELSVDELIVAQGCMPEVLTDFVEQVGRRSGWSFAIMGGGPDAANNGEITTISVHTGQDKYGHMFRRAYKDYLQAVEIPFSNHLNAVYPKSVRDKFIAKASTGSQTAASASSSGQSPASPVTSPPSNPDQSLPASVPSRSAASRDVVEGPAVPDVPAAVEGPATSNAPAAPATSNVPAAVEGPATSNVPAAPATSNVPAAPATSNAPAAPATSNTPAAPATSNAPAVPATSNVPAAPATSNAPAAPAVPHHTANVPLAANAPATPLGPPNIPIPPSWNTAMGTNKENQPMFETSFDKTAQAFDAYPRGPSIGLLSSISQHQPPLFQSNFTHQDVMSDDLYPNDGISGADSLATIDWEAFNVFLGNLNYTDVWQGNNHGLSSSANNFGQGTDQTHMGYNNAQAISTMPTSATAPWPAGGSGGAMNSQSFTYPNSQYTAAPFVAPVQTGASTGTPNNLTVAGGTESAVPAPGGAAVTPTATPPVNAAPAEGEEVSVATGPPSATDGQREQRTRRAPVSKEVVPLIEKQAREPEWILAAHEYLKNDITSVQWQELVNIWFKYETDSGLLETSLQRLPPKNRPAILSKWLSNRRQFNNIPAINDVVAFGVEWVTWWNGMQPKWRQNSTAGALPQPVTVAKNAEDLSSIKKAGPVGLVVAIISLKWWAGNGEGEGWLKAVEDVKASLQAMLTATPNLKRKGDSAGNVSDKRRKSST